MLQKRPQTLEKVGRNLSLTALVVLLATLPMNPEGVNAFYLTAQALVVTGFVLRLVGQVPHRFWFIAAGLFAGGMGAFSALAYGYTKAVDHFAVSEVLAGLWTDAAVFYLFACIVFLSQFFFRPQVWTNHDRWVRITMAIVWAFALMVVLSAVVSSNPPESCRFLRKYFFPYVLVYMIAIESIYSWRHYRILITTIFLVGIVFTSVSVSARYLYIYGNHDLKSEFLERDIVREERIDDRIELRSQWPFTQHNRLCSYALIVTFFVWLQFFVTRNWEIKTLTAISAILPIWTMVVTLTRGGWVALAAGALVLVLIINWRSVWILAAVAFAVWWVSPDVVRHRVDSIFDPRTYTSNFGTVGNRRVIWSRTIDILRQHPAFGIGPGWEVYENYMKTHYSRLEEDNIPHAHNNFLQMGVETGLVGLVLFLALNALLVMQLVRAWLDTQPQTNRRFVVAGFFGLFASITVFGLSNYSLRYNVGMLIWICLALITLLPLVARAIPEKVAEPVRAPTDAPPAPSEPAVRV